jgi:hypothetical protein
MLCTSPLARPGDKVEFKTGVFMEHFDNTYLWVKWSAPPIRRRREKTSAKMLMSDHVTLSDNAKARLEKYWKDRRALVEAGDG